MKMQIAFLIYSMIGVYYWFDLSNTYKNHPDEIYNEIPNLNKISKEMQNFVISFAFLVVSIFWPIQFLNRIRKFIF